MKVTKFRIVVVAFIVALAILRPLRSLVVPTATIPADGSSGLDHHEKPCVPKVITITQPPQTPCPTPAPTPEPPITPRPTAAALPPSKPHVPYQFHIHVFTYNRLDGLKRLWNSLAGADYMNHTVSMTVFHDFKPKNRDNTRQWLNGIAWPHGPLRVHRREQNTGLKKSIMEAWYPVGENEYGAFFEDDIEVSPLWYKWVHKALMAYVYSSGTDEPKPDAKLLGLSLFRPIHDELSGKKCIVNNDNAPFALQQPCSWGAVYFPTLWRYFRDWYSEHAGENPMVEDPNPSSNTWDHKSSWKKYLIKLMHEKGMFMVYPNLPEKLVLATNHLMKGEHPTPPRKLFELPLLEGIEEAKTAEAFANLPPLEEMRFYDLMFKSVGSGPKDLPNYAAALD